MPLGRVNRDFLYRLIVLVTCGWWVHKCYIRNILQQKDFITAYLSCTWTCQPEPVHIFNMQFIAIRRRLLYLRHFLLLVPIGTLLWKVGCHCFCFNFIAVILDVGSGQPTRYTHSKVMIWLYFYLCKNKKVQPNSQRIFQLQFLKVEILIM